MVLTHHKKTRQKQQEPIRNKEYYKEGVSCYHCGGPHYKYDCPALSGERLNEYRWRKNLQKDMKCGFFRRFMKDILKELMDECTAERSAADELNAKHSCMKISNCASKDTPTLVPVPTELDYPPSSNLMSNFEDSLIQEESEVNQPCVGEENEGCGKKEDITDITTKC